MVKHKKLAIVGRPNVGKSALFNRICGKRIAIVDEAEGITRDRLYAKGDLFGFPFEVIDTGGIDARSKAQFNDQIKQQAEIAIEEADTLIMVVDGQVGITPVDLEVAKILQRTQKPLCLAVNKIDSLGHLDLQHQFYPLGIPKIVPISCEQNFQIAELLETAFEEFPRETPDEEDGTTKIAVIGRANVGKSTLVNHLLDEERCIVSPIAGTTRDSVDIIFESEGEVFTLIDTAGIRRKNAEHEVVDKFAFMRTQRAIDRADVCVLMLDVQEGITAQDKKIANMIEEAGKGCILLFNKWDLVKGYQMEHCLKAIEIEAPFLAGSPALCISADSGRNLDKIVPLVAKLVEESKKRVPTGELNRFIETTMHKVHPAMIKGKRLRVYYMTQVDTCPPRFILFINYPDLMMDSYKRYLMNNFRRQFGYGGIPLIWNLRGKMKKNLAEAVQK